MSNIIDIEFTGKATVNCVHCGECYDVRICGSDTDLEEAVEEALIEKGWADDVCPSCLEDSQEGSSSSCDEY